jgi:polysaccharide deacetylase family protein (PEP-CTERM system associated)
LAAAGAKGTFFVLGWVAERHGALVRRIAETGNEVASHGYSHARIFDQDPEAFRTDVRKGRKILEDLIGKDVFGYRAPSFSVTRETLWALDVLAEEGFLYDSSIYPVYRGSYGIHDAKRSIHKVRLTSGNSMFEVPPACITTPVGRIPVGGGAYLRWAPLAFTVWAVGRINRRDGIPFVFYIHPWELDPDHPPVDRAGWVTRQRHYHGIPKNRAKVEYLLERFRFGTILETLQEK